MNRTCIHRKACTRGQLPWPCHCLDEKSWYSQPAVVVMAVIGVVFWLFAFLCLSGKELCELLQRN